MKLFFKQISKWVGAAALIAVAVWARQSGFFEKLLQTIHALGGWAAPAFLGTFILSSLLFFPSFIMTLGAGMIFPLPEAVFLSLLGNSLGAAAALLIGRYGLRAWVRQKAAANPQFQKLDYALQHEGWKIALLARLTPVFPFSAGNYLFGATSIPVWVYMATAFVGTIPFALVYAWLGRQSGSFSEIFTSSGKTPLEWLLLVLGIMAVFFLALFSKRFFERLFKDKSGIGKIKDLD